MYFNQTSSKLRILCIFLIAVTLLVPFNFFYPGAFGKTGETNPSIDLKKGLVGHWKFDSGGGDLATDYSPQNHDGTLTCKGGDCSGPKWVNAKVLTGLKFDGEDDYVNIEKGLTSIFQNHSFTISLWVFALHGNSHSLVGIGSNGRDQHLHVIIRGNNTLRFGFYADDLDSTNQIPRNTWWHITLTWESKSQERKIYFNGHLEASDTSSGPLKVPENSNFRIGWHSGSFKGIIDEVRLYSRALSEREVHQLFIDDY